MARGFSAWATWAITFLCACSAAIPTLPVQPSNVLVIHPGGYKPVDLTREELKQGMRMLYANGPLPGLPKNGGPRFLLVRDDSTQRLKAEGYLQWCQHLTGQRTDCWDDLNASSELDDEGATFVALHFALDEALEDAASAVRSMTPAQVRAMLSVMFLGMIVELLSPEPVTKVLFMVSMTSLIAFVGVDVFNHVVKGFVAMLDELRRARDFEGVRAAGLHYGQRIGPTVARIAVIVATYGIAKFAGLFKGSVLDLPGGSRAAALAEAQGFRLPDIEGARSATLAADGSVVIDLGGSAALAVSAHNGGAGAEDRLLWTSWDSYPKVTIDGRVYAKIGDRLYTRHAVERMMPKGLTTEGRGVSPQVVEDVIRRGAMTRTVTDGVRREIFRLGSIEVVTEQGGEVVVTVNPYKY